MRIDFSTELFKATKIFKKFKDGFDNDQSIFKNSLRGWRSTFFRFHSVSRPRIFVNGLLAGSVVEWAKVLF